MITIAIATHKGGTGKTVTAMALAAAFARDGQQTTLIDLDPQGHSTLGLGVELSDGDRTLRDLLTEPPARFLEVLRDTAVPNLTIVPSNIHVERTAQAQYMRPKREVVLQKALQRFARPPAFVIIDCPPSLGPLTENGIAAADWILIPCQMEARASEGLSDVLDLITVLKGEGFDRWRIVYTRVDARKTTTNTAIRAALAEYSEQTLTTIIPQSEPLNQAQIERTDIYSFDASCKGALAYRTLATEIRVLTEAATREAHRGQ